MNKKSANPDDLAGIRNKIGDLQKQINRVEQIANTVPRWQVFLRKFWEERNWSIPVTLVVLGGLGTGIWYAGSFILASSVQSSVTANTKDLQADVHRIDTDVQQTKLMIRVLQSQIASQKYLAVPSKDLKAHREEINQLKNNLEQVPSSAPGYWPAAFDVITLLSQASSGANPVGQAESIYDDISSNPVGLIRVNNGRVLLKNRISGVVFENSIVRFDPSVKLTNDLFINCIFVFPAVEQPPQPLQEIGRQLLTSDLSRITLNAT